MPDDFAWVIEHRNSKTSAPLYWCGNAWDASHEKAIRFARKVDAERTVAGFDEDDPLPDEGPHRICEHGWMERRDITDGRGRRDILRRPTTAK